MSRSYDECRALGGLLGFRLGSLSFGTGWVNRNTIIVVIIIVIVIIVIVIVIVIIVKVIVIVIVIVGVVWRADRPDARSPHIYTG